MLGATELVNTGTLPGASSSVAGATAAAIEAAGMPVAAMAAKAGPTTTATSALSSGAAAGAAIGTLLPPGIGIVLGGLIDASLGKRAGEDKKQLQMQSLSGEFRRTLHLAQSDPPGWHLPPTP